MKSLPASITLAALTLAGVLTTGCSSPEVNNHWHAYSIVPAVGKHGFGYDAQRDESLIGRVGQDTGAIWVTFRQHMLGSIYDPKNPLMGDVGHRSAPPPAPENPYDED
ncbi:MAG: hypothetical protein L6Q99_10825 [Planctomycetes bacterium]|nr:hypothetical protein [Planctomycetota bacterium]